MNRYVKQEVLRRLIAVALIGLGTWCVSVAMVGRPDVVPPVALDQLGLAPNHTEAAAVVVASTPKFMLVGAAADEDNSRKNVRLWDAMLALRGSHFPNVPQQIGDCVSWGAANAVNYLQAVQLTRGPPDAFEFAPADPPYIYGTSRITIGAKHGSRFRGDGSVGAYAAEGLKECGCLKATHPQCPPYNASRAKEWGDKGPPDWARDAAKRYTVETIANVDSADEIRDAVCHGFPVTVASNWGTKTIRPKDGRMVAAHDGMWPHQMCCIAYDGSGREPYWYLLNSWGPNAHPMPLQNEPPGGFWIDRKSMEYIAKQGDCWALSGFEGFPAEDLDWDQLLHRTRSTVGASAPPVPLVQEPIAMFSPMLLLGLVLFAVGAAMLMLGKDRRARIALGLIATVSLLPSLAYADEPPLSFVAASHRQAERVVETRVVESPAPLNWSRAEGTATAQADVGPMPTLNWSAMESPTLATAKQPAPRALVFIRSRNCSDCDKMLSWITKQVVPAGWVAIESPFATPAEADFQIIDVLKDTRLQTHYRVQAVPTVVYLDKQGQETARFEGFTPPRSLTEELNRLR